jgi:signal transduction histidine kinase
MHINPLNHYVGAATLLVCLIALALLWTRHNSVLDQWLMVVALAAIAELVLAVALVTGRFTLGFYAGRLFALVTSTTVLIVLLAETTRLYAALARSNMMLERERSNKLMNLEAVIASISHEVKQPLTAITLNGKALLRFLGNVPPNLGEVRSAAERMIRDGYHISEVLNNIRALFGQSDQEKTPVDVNDLALAVLRDLDAELKSQEIVTRVKLTPNLPPVMGHRGQLQEVINNLVRNAIEAMELVRDRRRELQVRTQHNDTNSIVIEIEDSGQGLDPKKIGTIFEAFVTTKVKGTGLGLAICRLIVERHEGQLSAVSANPRGAIFRVILPRNSPLQ